MLKNSFWFLMVVLCLYSCDKERVFDDYKSIDGGKWHMDSIVSFEFEQKDTVSKYDLFINIRDNNKYPYSNLFLIVQMQKPGTKLVTIDTLEYEMANPDGTLMGEGFSDIKENKLWYKEAVSFPKQGKYTVSIQQAMRQTGDIAGVEELEGITEVGFRIESKE